MRFESQKDLERETKAIKTFCAAYNLNFEKQSEWDVDFVVFNSEYRTHVEVKGRLRMIKDCFRRFNSKTAARNTPQYHQKPKATLS